MELAKWEERFKEKDLSYFEDLIRNGGFLIGFEEMDTKDLEEEYYEMFGEEVQIG